MTKWHLKSVQEVMETLSTNEKGLTFEEADARLARYGENYLPSEPPPSIVKIFIQQFSSPLMYILLIAAVVSFLLGEYNDATFIFLALLLNSIVGTYQEWNAAKNTLALQSVVPHKALIIRDGQKEEIEVKEVVPGDAVVLEAGLRVPADLRLHTANGLEIDESLLTGESLPVVKNTDVLTDAATPLGDRANTAFASTIVTRGSGLGIVTDTGWSTEIGKIAKVITTTETKTPLVLRMESFTKNIVVMILVVAFLLGLLAFYKGYELEAIFFMAVALAVSAIPEGLPIGITVALANGMRRMARRNVIVRKLVALEGLGSCTVISSDKTGTLTYNELTLKLISLPRGKEYEVSGEGYTPIGSIKETNCEIPLGRQAMAHINRLAETGVLCNEATFYEKEQQWHHYGDSVDIALLVLGEKLGIRHRELLEREPRLAIIPFDAQLKYAATFHKQDDMVRVAVKGAYEVLLPRCRHMLQGDAAVPVDAELIEGDALRLAEKGYRVLALADGCMSSQASYDDHDAADLTFLGLICMIDPLRQEAKEAVEECKQAGVKVCMVTGDHPLTALAIARELGIAAGREDIITGGELHDSYLNETPEELLRIIDTKTVFARVEPTQKQLIVKAQADNGHFVAVTGDGVNDAPALKEANIGVAMGTGTDVAKETADIVLTDDNFASLVAGIEEGRIAYNNIRKIAYLLLSMAVAEVLLFILSIGFGYPLPLIAVQILWLNLATNGLQDMAMAFEPGEGDEMQQAPRSPQEGVFNKIMVQQMFVSGIYVGLVGFLAWIFFLDHLDMNEFTARNSLLLMLVLFENFHVFNCKSEQKSLFRIPFFGNKVLLAAVIGAQGLHLLSMHLPIMQRALHLEPVSLTQWIYTLLFSMTIMIVMELFKFIIRKRDVDSGEQASGEPNPATVKCSES
ncbi:MAG: HAD-IC family P-type ATPase [Syntrophomonadaceae bacterium]|nr:HAD-IC family P-type ATPase [Syntrophomonadaceae bacterium]